MKDKIKSLRDIYLTQAFGSAFALPHILNIKFTSVSDYRALYGLCSYFGNMDLTDGDFDYLARTITPEEIHMLNQVNI